MLGIVHGINSSLILRIVNELKGEITPSSYPKNYDEATLKNPELCKTCGGKCCKRCGCFVSPDDFEKWFGTPPTLELMERELKRGYLTIEIVDLSQYWLSGFGTLVRMRNSGESAIIDFDGRCAGAGACVAWREEGGCMFDWEQRPAGGKLLGPIDPQFGMGCTCGYGTKATIAEWRMFPGILPELTKKYRWVNIPCPDDSWMPFP